MFDTKKIQQEVYRLLKSHYIEISVVLGVGHDQPVFRADSSLSIKVALLCEVANGQHGKSSAEASTGFEEVMDGCVWDVMTALHRNAWGADEVSDEHFWTNEIGQVVERCIFWLREDDLLTHTEAAQMLRGATSQADIMYVQRLVKRGKLTRYTDPNEPNPRRAGRVSRQEVEGLRDGFANGH